MYMERFQPEWIDVPVRVRHPAVIALKMAVGGVFVAPAVAIWAVCFGMAMVWIGGKRAVRYALASQSPFVAPAKAGAHVSLHGRWQRKLEER